MPGPASGRQMWGKELWSAAALPISQASLHNAARPCRSIAAAGRLHSFGTRDHRWKQALPPDPTSPKLFNDGPRIPHARMLGHHD